MQKKNKTIANTKSVLSNEALWQETEAIAKAGSWALDLQTKELYWSDGVYRLLEYAPQSFLPDYDKGIDIIHPDDRAKAIQVMNAVMSHGGTYSTQFRVVTASGAIKLVQSSGNVLCDENNVPIKLIGVFQDITDLRTASETISQSEERFEILMKAGTDCFWDYDLTRNELFLSDGYSEKFGIEGKELKQNFDLLVSHLHPNDKDRVLKSFEAAIKDTNEGKWFCEYRLLKANGETAYVKKEAALLRDSNGIAYRALGTVKDITKVFFYQQFEVLEKEVMQYSMTKNIEINDILEFYIQKLEGLFPEMRASVLGVQNHKINNLASPSLPQDYIRAIEGLAIGNNVASFGAAAYGKHKVIAADVLRDKNWENFADLAVQHGIRSCWSYPIFNAEGVVIATFNAYHAIAKLPTVIEEHVMEHSSRLIALFIEKCEYIATIQKDNERYELINKTSRDAIYEWDGINDIFYWSEGFYSLFGHPKRKEAFRLADWEALMHPSDHQKLAEKWVAFLNNPKRDKWEKEFRFQKADGTYTYVEEIGHLIRNAKGEPLRMIGVLRDVTLTKMSKKQKKFQYQVSAFFKTENSLNTILSDVLHFLTVSGALQNAEIWFTGSNQKYINVMSSYAHTPKGSVFFSESKSINKLQKGEGLPGEVWKTGRIVIWDNIDETDLFIRKESAQKAGLKSAMGLPLFHKDKVIGVLLLFSDSKQFFNASFQARFEPLQHYLGDEIKRKQQEEEMYLLFHSAPEIMAIVSAERYFVKVNSTFYRLLGYSEAEVEDKSLDFFVHPDDLQKATSTFMEAINEGKRLVNSTVRYRTKSGDYRWISWSTSGFFGQEKMMFAYGRDVTETIRLDELLKETSKLALVGAWELDVVHNVLYWSPMTKIIHEVPEDFQPDLSSLISFCREDYRETVKAFIDNDLKKGKPFDFEAPIITAKGNERWIRAIGNAEFFNGKAIRFYGSLQDIHNQKIAEFELQKSLEERNNILESIGDAFFAVNRDWIVTYWNREAENVLERKRESIVGTNLWDAYPEAVGLKFYTEYHKAMETGEIVHFEEYNPVRNQWFEVSAYPAEEGLSVYFKDVSIRKITEEQIRQTNERFEKVTEATSDAIWDWDIEQDTYYRSDGFERLFGCKIDSGEASQEFWQNHFSDEDKMRIRKSVAKALENPETTHWELEYGIRRQDGSSAYVIDRGVIIRNPQGKAVRMIGAMTDITYQKEYEESLKSLNARLEEKANELMISNKELEQFAYVASHDLQEPLRMVTSFLTQLKKKYGDQLDEKAHQYIHFAVDGSLRMRQIILDILEFSRVGKHEDNKEQIDLNEIVQEVSQLQHRLIEEKRATLNFETLPVVTSYRSPLVQVFQNLIGNALKYSKPDVPAVISVLVKEHPGEWELVVKDNGIGISKEYHEKIFILFQRLHVKEQYVGTGIGLAIVKKILDHLGGRIWVESKEGEGSAFHFTLPKQS